MERWEGKVAVVTGASSGIGAAIAVDLVNLGVTVVGLARRVDLIDELRQKLPRKVSQKLHCVKCDIRNEDQLMETFKWINKDVGGVDILINNAGVFKSGNLLDEGNTERLKATLDTNVLGAVLCTREAFKSMQSRGVDGHVIMINSLAGNKLALDAVAGSMNMYGPSKQAVTAITEVLRQEFNALNSKTKVTSISPGMVMTEMTPELLRKNELPHMEPADISAAVQYALATPKHVQVHELTVRAVGQRI